MTNDAKIPAFFVCINAQYLYYSLPAIKIWKEKEKKRFVTAVARW